MRHQKASIKRNPNSVHPFHAPLTYHQQGIPPLFHTVLPPPHIPMAGYAYQPSPGSFPSVETNLIKSGNEVPIQAFVPPVYGSMPPALGETNTYVANFSTRRPNVQKPCGHFNPAWHNQQAFGSNENINVQQSVGPRAFVRPQFFSPALGLITGPTFPGMFDIKVPLVKTCYINFIVFLSIMILYQLVQFFVYTLFSLS